MQTYGEQVVGLGDAAKNSNVEAKKQVEKNMFDEQKYEQTKNFVDTGYEDIDKNVTELKSSRKETYNVMDAGVSKDLENGKNNVKSSALNLFNKIKPNYVQNKTDNKNT